MAERNPRNIVICADGTSNTFDHDTNVARFVELIEIGPHQIVAYDEGVGARRRTSGDRLRMQKDRDLRALDPPFRGQFGRYLGLLFGYGLKCNVGEMYEVVASTYQPGDRIYLIGFSRGAFTVRVVAALLYRHPLVTGSADDISGEFQRIWRAFKRAAKTRAGKGDHIEKLESQEVEEIHFLGIWDTVKAYGGIWPPLLPSLRHNPAVKKVRHALALDETRHYFLPTSWGGLDGDANNLEERRDRGDPSRSSSSMEIGSTDVIEKWFTGVHSDVGGGKNAPHNRPALSWMLDEAAKAGIHLTDAGRAVADQERHTWAVAVSRPSRTTKALWKLAAWFPHTSIDNSGVWPRRRWCFRHPGGRCLTDYVRNGGIDHHHSAAPSDSASA